jgi:hypothetical protein
VFSSESRLFPIVFSRAQDEHGASPWAAAAQQIMASPLPDGFAFGAAHNEFRLLRYALSVSQI